MQPPLFFDPRIKVSRGSVSTTDATATVIDTLPIATGETIGFLLNVTGRRTGGSSGTAGASACIIQGASFRNDAGTVAQVGSAGNMLNANPFAFGGITYVVSGTNVQIKVTGLANNNINWASTTYITSIS